MALRRSPPRRRHPASEPLSAHRHRVGAAATAVRRRKRPRLRRVELTASLYGLTSFWVLAEVDVGLARHYLDPHSAGLYSSAGVLARALLFLPGAVGIVAFPHFVAARASGKEQLRWLRMSVGA